jgi:hypothetical protein
MSLIAGRGRALFANAIPNAAALTIVRRLFSARPHVLRESHVISMNTSKLCRAGKA